MINLSTYDVSESITLILVEIFEPPIIPIRGFFGFTKIFFKASNSSSTKKPTPASATESITPKVDACLRCAVPKASMM